MSRLVSISIFGAFLLVVMLSGEGPAQAANLLSSCPPIGNSSKLVPGAKKVCDHVLWLSGEFVPGDYEKVRAALRAHRFRTVGLYESPGGDLSEAMKIGSLIRRLRMTTIVTVNETNGSEPGGVLIPIVLENDQQATCASACVFVWLSGIKRRGNWRLIVHRPYFDADYFAGLSADDADSKYGKLEEDAYGFLRSMDVPEALVATMKRTSSEDGVVLQPKYVSDWLEGESPSYDEWLTSKCGRVSREDETWILFYINELGKAALNAGSVGPSEDDTHRYERLSAVQDCRNRAAGLAAKDAWKVEFESP